MEKPTNPLAKVYGMIDKTVSDWQMRQSPEKLKEDIEVKLDKHKDEIVLKLLGFNNSWGAGYQLDHCNGRAGNSTASDYLKSVQGKAINEWLETVAMPSLNRKDHASILKSFQAEYDKAIMKAIQSAAYQQAERDARELVASLTDTGSFDRYLKTIELLQEK